MKKFTWGLSCIICRKGKFHVNTLLTYVCYAEVMDSIDMINFTIGHKRIIVARKMNEGNANIVGCK